VAASRTPSEKRVVLSDPKLASVMKRVD